MQAGQVGARDEGLVPTSPRFRCDALVLDAALRQSLVTVRSLGSRGLRVAALEVVDHPHVPAFSSRWCQYKAVSPAAEGTEAYLAYLEQVLATIGARVLIPSSDGTVALLRRYRERLEGRVALALAREPALEVAVNKERTLEIAARLGLATPKGVTVSGVDEVEAALREVGLPAVIKPVESWVEGKGERARLESRLVVTPEEARRAVDELTQLGGTTLFQQYLSGRREAVNFLYASGQVYARFAQWAKRTDPPLGGSSVLRQSIAVPADTGEQAERLVREIDLEGYCEVEFRRDAHGTPYLMEINPRLSASIELAVRSGVDFPYLLYCWANGDPIEPVKTYATGGWMRDLGGDIVALMASLQEQGRPGIAPSEQVIFDFCASFFKPMWYDYLVLRDLRPARTACLDFGQRLLHWTGEWLLRLLPGRRDEQQSLSGQRQQVKSVQEEEVSGA